MGLSYAIISGLCASFASMFGKLSGQDFIEIDERLRYFAKVICLCLMVFLNGLVWVFFVKALHSSKTSIEATAVSSAANYVLSGILGYLIFHEVLGFLWYVGIGFIVTGISILSIPNSK